MVELRSGKNTVGESASMAGSGPGDAQQRHVLNPLKLTSYVDRDELKARQDFVNELNFTGVRGEDAVAFKRVAQSRLGSLGLPDALQVELLVRAVEKANHGPLWLSYLTRHGLFPATTEAFWQEFDEEFMSMDSKKHAHNRFLRMRMGANQSVSQFVDEFRDAYVNLIAMGAPDLPEQWLFYIFLSKLPLSIRSAVEAHLAGDSTPTTAKAERIAVMVGSASVSKPARMTKMRSSAPTCYVCGEVGHMRAQCPKAKKSSAEDKPDERRHSAGSKPRGKGTSQKN